MKSKVAEIQFPPYLLIVCRIFFLLYRKFYDFFLWNKYLYLKKLINLMRKVVT